MKAREKNLLEFMSGMYLVVPKYQRHYNWTQENCAQLWDDIIRVGILDNAPHFIGSIVYVLEGSTPKMGENPFLVIDGQQRITTLSLLLIALREKMTDIFLDNIDEKLATLCNEIKNSHYLISPKNGIRLTLSTQEDENIFSQLVNHGKSDNTNNSIERNFRYFKGRLQECDEKTLIYILNGLQKLEIIDVSLNKETGDDPQLIFESMNSKGKPLTQADLIRNYILMDTNNQDELYETWKILENYFKSTKDGFDNFMYRYLIMELKTLDFELTRVYTKFKEYAKDKDKKALLTRLKKYAEYYCQITTLIKSEESDLHELFQELNQIQPKQAYPFLLQCHDYYANKQLTLTDFKDIINLVISYIIRIVVCREKTNNLNQVFVNAIKSIEDSQANKSDSKELHNLIVSFFININGDTAFPDDGNFMEALQVCKIYNFKSIRRHILERLENYGEKEKSEVREKTIQIEHIVPQTPAQEWIEDLGQEYQEVYNIYLHTLGNLTLTGYNSKYSNNSFKTKRDMEKGFKESVFRLNKDIAKCDRWGKKEIKARAKNLAEKALKIWTKPQAPL